MKGYRKGYSPPKREDMAGRRKKLTVQAVLDKPYADLSSRGIRSEVVEHFNIRMDRSLEDGITPTAYYFPYYDQQGKLCGWKVKDLTVPKHDDFHYTTIGKVGVDCKLFGQQEAEGIRRKHKAVVLVEGELDVPSVYQAALDCVANTNYAGMEPFVVGLNCGCPNAVESIIHNQAFIESFDKVVLAFDADAASPKELKRGVVRGKEATEAVAAHLMGRSIHVAQQPEGCKDANDALLEGRIRDLYNNYFFASTPYKAEKILTAADVSLEKLLEPKPEGFYVETMPELMKLLHGFHKNTLTVVTSLSGIGKSTVVGEIAYCLAQAGARVGMIFLEEQETETMQRIMARYCEVPFNAFKADPLSVTTREQATEAYEWMKEGQRFVFMDHFGSIPVNELMSHIRYFHRVHKVDFLFLDHLSMVVSGHLGDNERKDLDILMTELAAYVASNDLGVIAVCHLNRDAKDAMKGLGRIEEPVWIQVKKEDLKGSSSLEQLAWVILGIDFEFRPDRKRGRIRMTALKNRPWGSLGEGDILRMNETTGVLEDASDGAHGEDFDEDIEF